MSEKEASIVFVVEDDAFIANLYEAHLKGEGYQARSANTGEQGLKEMAASRPDLVLLDLVLPDISGYEVLAKMREIPGLADVPVVFFSNKGEPEDIERGLALGATDYLVKSTTSPKQVMAKIAQVLGREASARAPLRVAIRLGEMDAGKVAEVAGMPSGLRCDTCGRRLILELEPRNDEQAAFDARLACPECSD